MKTRNKRILHITPLLKTGAVIGLALLSASTLRAQVPGQGNVPDTSPPLASTTSGNISHRAKEFLKDAAQANQMEISMADVALERSQNSQVRDLAQTMRTDHQMNFGQLQKVARDHGVELDSALSFMNQHEVNRLQKADAVDFDREYTTAMIKDHVNAIKTFDKAIADIQAPDVREYAQNTLPVLRGHLMKSEKAARAVGVSQDKISSYLKELPTGEAERSLTINQ